METKTFLYFGYFFRVLLPLMIVADLILIGFGTLTGNPMFAFVGVFLLVWNSLQVWRNELMIEDVREMLRLKDLLD